MRTIPVKTISTAITAVLVFAIAAPWKIVGQGEVAVPSKFGKVQSYYLEEGFNFPVSPLLSFDMYDTKLQSIELDEVAMPSQDKFTSTMKLTVQYTLDKAVVNELRGQVGTMGAVEKKLVRDPLDSILREAGRSVAKAQDLYNAETQAKIQNYVMQHLTEVTKPEGIHIKAVYMSDIDLPTVIKQAIVKTKKMQEAEEQEKSELRRQETVFARQTAKAEANALSAEQNAIASGHAADAARYRAEQEADAKLYSAQKEAAANKALAKSVTPDLLKLKQMEVDMTEARNWKGGVPQTVMSGGEQPIRLFHMGQK